MPLPKRLKPETPGSKRQPDGHCRTFTEFTLQFNFGARQVRRHATNRMLHFCAGESSEEKSALILDRWEASAAAQQGFALPRDTTLWPVIGRASLPASRV